MTSRLNILLEVGPKGKKHAAFAPDWPGLSRGGKTEESAVESLLDYVPRYAPIVQRAGLDKEYSQIGGNPIVRETPGTPSTDFWGISFAMSNFDREPMSSEDLERYLALLQGCWWFFDDVAGRVSAEMQKGPRGGGRDRDQIIRHTLFCEQEFRCKVGFSRPERTCVDPAERNAGRDAYLEAIRAYHAEGRLARKWPLRYLIRHSAYHMLDHAWEMEDKDLSNGTVGMNS